MRAGLSHVSAGLLRAIRARAGGLPAGEGGEGGEPLLVIEDFGETPWASLTFSGLRHSVDINRQGDPVLLQSTLIIGYVNSNGI